MKLLIRGALLFFFSSSICLVAEESKNRGKYGFLTVIDENACLLILQDLTVFIIPIIVNIHVALRELFSEEAC